MPGRDQGNPVSRGRSGARPGDAGRESADAHPLVRLLCASCRWRAGLDVADKRIVELLHAQDLVITADIPLAAAVIEKGAHALNPRGELYTKDNIRERLSMRNFMDELRGSGVVTGGPAVLSQRDRQAFANSPGFIPRPAPSPTFDMLDGDFPIRRRRCQPAENPVIFVDDDVGGQLLDIGRARIPFGRIQPRMKNVEPGVQRPGISDDFDVCVDVAR